MYSVSPVRSFEVVIVGEEDRAAVEENEER